MAEQVRRAGLDGKAGSSVGEGSLRGVQSSSRVARRATQSRQCHVAGHEQPRSRWPRVVLLPRASVLSQQAQASSTKQEGSRTATRAQEVAAMLDETLSFYVKLTGNDESLMRRQFTGMKFENLGKERDRWRNRAEAKQRFQDKKEEAWELFQRQPRLGPTRKEEFEREYKQKVTAAQK